MDVKSAIRRAKDYATEILEDEKVSDLGLEEVTHEGGEWSITLGFSRPWNTPRNPISAMTAENPLLRSYRVFTVDDQTGTVTSMRIREMVVE